MDFDPTVAIGIATPIIVVAILWAARSIRSGLFASLEDELTEKFATKEDLADERKDRKTADEHRDQEQRRVAEIMQQLLGKVEMMERQQEKADRERERDLLKLQEEVRTGFARMEAALERFSKRNKGE